MPIVDVVGRGSTLEEAVQDMWERIVKLEDDGYHPITSVEVVDNKTNQILESFMLTDPEWTYLKPAGGKKAPKSKTTSEEHHPPKPHEYKFKARIKLEL